MMMKKIKTDILVIGGALGGCWAAIHAKEVAPEWRVTIVDRGCVGKSGPSTFAAGAYTACFPEDDREKWILENLRHSVWLSDQDWMEVIADESYERLLDMGRWGVLIRKEPDGRFYYGKGRAWSKESPTIKSVELAGPQMMWAMRRQACRVGAEVVQRVCITDLLKEDHGVTGAVGFHVRSGEPVAVTAKATIMAAGGTGFKGSFLGYRDITGDGHAMLYRAGVELMNLEFALRNHTAVDMDIAGTGRFVAEGAVLVNARGERFMEKYDPEFMERATNSHLCYGMAVELREGRGPILMDMSRLDPSIKDEWRRPGRLPHIMKILDRGGLNLTRDRVRWTPGGLYNIECGGGARINLRCETNVPGLFVAGAGAAAPPSHIENPQAINLPVCAITGYRAAESAVRCAGAAGSKAPSQRGIQRLVDVAMRPLEREEGPRPDEVLTQIQEIMEDGDTTLIKHEKRLERAIEALEEVWEEKVARVKAEDPHDLAKAHSVRSMALVGEMILKASLLRKESRAAHFREDFPMTDNDEWLKWILVRREGNRMALSTEPLPMETYKYPPPLGRRPLYPALPRGGRRAGSNIGGAAR